MIEHTVCRYSRKQRVLLSMAALSFMTALYSSPLMASAAECSDNVDDNRFNSEICVQQDLDTQVLAMQRIYQSLQGALPEKEKKTLADTQKQWLAFQSGHCDLLVHIAGEQNPAWQMTWSHIAATSCKAELTKERVMQLMGLERMVSLKAQQNAAHSHTMD